MGHDKESKPELDEPIDKDDAAVARKSRRGAPGGNALAAVQAERHEMREGMVRTLSGQGLAGDHAASHRLGLPHEHRHVKVGGEKVEQLESVNSVDKHDFATAATLSSMQSTLTFFDGVFRLTGPELVETAKKNPTVFGVHMGTAMTIGTIVRAATEVAVGCVGMVSSIAWLAAKATGDAAAATKAQALTVGTVARFGQIFAAVQVVHGIFLMIEDGADLEQKVEGASEVASGGGFLAGTAITGTMGGGLISLPLWFVVRAVGAVLLAHERGERESWMWNYIDQISATLAEALSEGSVTPEQSGGGTEQWEARRAAFNDAIAILEVWGPKRTHELAAELASLGSGSALRRKLRSEIAASAGLHLDETSASSRFHPPPRPER